MSEWFAKMTVGALLDRAAETFGPRTALRFGGRGWTFGDLQADVDRASRGLLACGIQPNDKVALWLLNRPEWLHIWLAVAKIGAVLVPINTRLRTNDLAYVLRQSESSMLITADRSGPIGYLDMVRELIPRLGTRGESHQLAVDDFPALRRVVTVSEQQHPGTRRWQDVVAAGDAVPVADLARRQNTVDPDATCLIMYTSGTTGFPKGVMHNHSMVRMATDIANRLAMRSTDVLLMYLPLFHIFGLYQGPMVSLVSGACQVVTEHFDPGESLRLIEQERVTRLYGFDTHFHDLMHHPDCERTDRSSLRFGLLAAGLASTEPVARRAQTRLCPTVSGWGMTESGASPVLSCLLDSEDDRCTASGLPLPGYRFKVIDPDTGDTQPYGTPGELCCTGYQVMQGYYRKPDETARALDAEGWLHTGDMAIMRDDGTIRFIGRYKEMLKVGGENVDPVEVEAFLMQHPAINQVKIVGVPDPRLHEVGCACVVLEPGATLRLDELRAFAQGKVASFKIPHHLVLVKEYPMTSSGKVQKFKLRELCIETLQLESN